MKSSSHNYSNKSQILYRLQAIKNFFKKLLLKLKVLVTNSKETIPEYAFGFQRKRFTLNKIQRIKTLAEKHWKKN